MIYRQKSIFKSVVKKNSKNKQKTKSKLVRCFSQNDTPYSKLKKAKYSWPTAKIKITIRLNPKK